MTLQPGYYANMFEVSLQGDEAPVVICDRSKYTKLKDLRDEITKAGKDVFVYAPGHSNVIYGYGKDKEWLRDKDFTDDNVSLHEVPQLTGRMIHDAFINRAKELGYSPVYPFEIGRCRLYNWNGFRPTSDGNVKVFLGFDTRVVFLSDEPSNKLSFDIIVDVRYKLKYSSDNPVNFHDIVTRFGGLTLKNVRQIQRDLIPTGINTEVSRQRMIEQVLPFIGKIGEITLPCGVKASISLTPVRIIVGAEL